MIHLLQLHLRIRKKATITEFGVLSLQAMKRNTKALDLLPKASGSNKKLKYFKSFLQQLPNRSCCFVYVHLFFSPYHNNR